MLTARHFLNLNKNDFHLFHFCQHQQEILHAKTSILAWERFFSEIITLKAKCKRNLSLWNASWNVKPFLNLGSIPNPGQFNCEVQAGSVCTYYPSFFSHQLAAQQKHPHQKKNSWESYKNNQQNLQKTKQLRISPTALTLVSPGNIHNTPDVRDHVFHHSSLRPLTLPHMNCLNDKPSRFLAHIVKVPKKWSNVSFFLGGGGGG